MKYLTLKDALLTAQAMEAADKNAKTLQGSESASTNQFTKSQSRGGNSRKPTANQIPSASQKSPSSQPWDRCGKPTRHRPLTVSWILTAITAARRATSVQCANQRSRVWLPACNQSRSVSKRTALTLRLHDSTPPEEELHLHVCHWSTYNKIKPNQVLGGC